MTDDQRVPVWSWRDAIRKATVPPLTKLVLYTLATYLSDVGDGCYPSMRTLMSDTGLSNKSLTTHFQNAADAGLLAIVRSRKKDGTLGRNRYMPQFPAACRLARTPADMRTEHDDDEDDDDARHQVNELHLDGSDQVNLLPSPGEHGALHQVKEIHFVKNSIRNFQGKNSTPPLPPARRGARERAIEFEFQEAIDQQPDRRRVVDLLLRRLLTTRRLDAPSKAGTIRAIADWSMAAALPDEALTEVCDDLLAARGYSVKASDIEGAIKAKAKALEHRTTWCRPATQPPRDPRLSASATPRLLEALGRLVGADALATVFGDLRVEELHGTTVLVSVGRSVSHRMIELSYSAQINAAALGSVPGAAGVYVEVRRDTAKQAA